MRLEHVIPAVVAYKVVDPVVAVLTKEEDTKWRK
jgi:hypothetical protein